MAQLSDIDRARIWRGLMRRWSNLRELLEVLTKQQLRDAINATDVWIDDSQASYNSALPVAARNALTTSQKTLLFCAVALARVSISMLRQVFGEVN